MKILKEAGGTQCFILGYLFTLAAGYGGIKLGLLAVDLPDRLWASSLSAMSVPATTTLATAYLANMALKSDARTSLKVATIASSLFVSGPVMQDFFQGNTIIDYGLVTERRATAQDTASLLTSNIGIVTPSLS